MSSIETLKERSGGVCELCAASDALSIYDVSHAPSLDEGEIVICATCKAQLEGEAPIQSDHWRALADSMWSGVGAVQVMAYRMLHRLEDEEWARGLLETLYVESDIESWAQKGMHAVVADAPTLDSNGAPLQGGDSVTIIKDLEVKGAGFTAKRGTVVKNITLTDNPEQIEGRVNGVRIVLLSKFLKKV
ncbi:MAG: PhnA domain-containing protein [Campylobacterales bacterium]|nr:PhnA domain-containing protein [Campylobacterales bacterium]